MTETLTRILPGKLEKMAEDVLKKAGERDLPLAVAESCTGGLLAALLTDVKGKSHMFERGFVVYTEDAKCELLGVDREEVNRLGAVSREVAIDMAVGALKASRASIALSITGFAGPGGDDDEEGLVHFACARKGHETAHREEHFGPRGRAGVRIAALEVALAMIEDALDA